MRESIVLTPGEISSYYRVRVPKLKSHHSGEQRSPCPIHKGQDDNFAVDPETGRWFCHSKCGRGGDAVELEKALTGLDFRDAKAELFRLIGRNSNGHSVERREVERYPYLDREGRLKFEAVRYAEPTGDKSFKQCRPDGRGGVIWNLNGVERVPYRLPKLLCSDTIYLPEGEKDVHALEGWGLTASCNPGGTGQGHLYKGWVRYFKDKHVVILPDNDEPGRKHAAAVAAALLPAAASVRIVELPGLAPKGDVSDWKHAGGTLEEFQKLVKASPEMDAAAISELLARWGLGPEPVQKVNRADAVPDLLPLPHNDHGNERRLFALYGEELRYCHALKKWLVFDGKRWAIDDTGRARHLAKQAMLEFLKQAMDRGDEKGEKFARLSLDARRISSMLIMAECETFVRPAELDTDPFALNFMNGTVDLRTGELRKHNRLDYITKLVWHKYAPKAECQRWRMFLDQVMGGCLDAPEGSNARTQRLVTYLQRALGYSMTGVTIEKAVFVPFGSGDNGKSTMLSTFRNLIEEYSVLLQVDTLMVRQESNNTQADLADLRGARFVQTSETEEGQRLAQGKLKRITQGMGKIKATRKYENPIEFTETHKLWIDTNQKPTIRDADDRATFNRLHPIPFTVTIPASQIDKELPGKLLSEAEGILAWAVDGARMWYADGLGKPAEVEAAKDRWRDEMDQIGRFISERCVVEGNSESGAAALYADYKHWAETSGERLLVTSTAFGMKLADRGFEKKHTRLGSLYQGIRVL